MNELAHGTPSAARLGPRTAQSGSARSGWVLPAAHASEAARAIWFGGGDLMTRADLPRLTIRAERSDKTEGKHRSEFRYGSFNRARGVPA